MACIWQSPIRSLYHKKGAKAVVIGTQSDDEKEIPEMEKEESVIKYRPQIYLDLAEPFTPCMIGYTIFEEKAKSKSCSRVIDPAVKKADLCIEYAWYYDYDIQHLYDLEHIWVYVEKEGNVCGCEASFHGRFYNMMLPGIDICPEGNQVYLYVQPGKHAFMPNPEMFHLFLSYDTCCASQAGLDGILTPDEIIEGLPEHTEADDRETECYIKEKYGFHPAEKYELYKQSIPLMKWEEMKLKIPQRMKKCMEEIRCSRETVKAK